MTRTPDVRFENGKFVSYCDDVRIYAFENSQDAWQSARNVAFTPLTAVDTSECSIPVTAPRCEGCGACDRALTISRAAIDLPLCAACCAEFGVPFVAGGIALALPPLVICPICNQPKDDLNRCGCDYSVTVTQEHPSDEPTYTYLKYRRGAAVVFVDDGKVSLFDYADTTQGLREVHAILSQVFA